MTTNTPTNYAAPSQISVNTLSSTMNWNAALFPTSEVGPNGDTASIGYSSGRPSTTTSPFGAVTNYTYADSAPASKTATTNGHWVRTTMDGFGRTVKTETGNGSTTVSIVDTVYVSCGCSPLGKMGQQSVPYAPGGGAYVTTYTYDGMGRTLSVLAPDGVSTTNYSYSGNTVTVTDPAGKTKTFTMDAFGNLTKVQEPDPTLGTVTTYYTYDILNHLTQVSMPRGANTQTRTFVYNTGNTVGVRLLSATNPENGTVSYTYNPDGTLATKTDAKNQVFTYTYDSYKRVTEIRVGGNLLRTFIYDSNTLDNTFSGSYTAGRLVAVQHTPFYPGTVNAIQFTEMYSYTQPGQAAKKRLQVTETLPYGQGLTIPRTLNLDAAQTYDTEGKMTSVNYPTTYGLNGASTTGPTYSYQFDAMSRPNVLTDQNSSVIVNNLQYGPANELKQISYGGLTETRQYSAMLQMTHLSIPGQLDINYNFPTSTNNGKITSQTDNLSGETISYQYDSLNRLLSASASGWNQTFGYDAFGSLVSKTGTNAPVLSIGVDPATNRIVGQPYDANGNQLTGGLGYDPENRIQTAPGVQYAYDSSNKRIWRGTFDVNGNLTAQEAYFYGVGGQKLGTYALTVVQQNNQQPQLTDSNTDSAVFFGSKRVLSGGGAFIQDRIGSARRSQSGAAMSYYPYGEDRGTSQPNDQLKFSTYTRDTATGLDYADQRYYANNFGRFISPDPSTEVNLANPTDWNKYSYVLGDPVNFSDRTGLNADACVPDDDSGYCQHLKGQSGYWGIGLSYFWNGEGYSSKAVSVWVPTNQQSGQGGGGGIALSDSVMREEWYAGLERAIRALKNNKDCADLFGLTGPVGNTSPGAETVLARISNSYEFGPIASRADNTVASATTTGIGAASISIGSGATIQVNTGVVITVNNTSKGASFVSGTVNDWAVTILHELGHAYWDLYGIGTSMITPDGTSVKDSETNTDRVKTKCKL